MPDTVNLADETINKLAVMIMGLDLTCNDINGIMITGSVSGLTEETNKHLDRIATILEKIGRTKGIDV
jgi:hypothetical protein